MNTSPSKLIAERSEAIYKASLKGILEQTACDRFVAIEPDSGEHFLGDTLTEAIRAARGSHPDKIVYGRRIGSRPAVHLGIHGV